MDDLVLSFKVIQEEYDSLLLAAGNILERNRPRVLSDVPGAAIIVRGNLLVSENTYRTIRYFCADSPADPARKVEYAATVPPLARTILDSLFNIVFFFNDVCSNAPLFWKAAWRQAKEEYDRVQQAYGNDPVAKSWLEEYSRFIDGFAAEYGISAEEAQHPDSIKYWPIPSHMLRDAALSESRRSYATYLHAWFYKALSSGAHMSGPGFMMRASCFVYDDLDARDRVLGKYRSDGVFTTLTLMLAIVSEIESELGLGLSQRAKYLWTILSEYWGEAKELNDRRYKKIL